MPMLVVNGLEIPVMVDGADSARVNVEQWGRAIDDSLQGTAYSRKRAASVDTGPMTSPLARALEGWCTGEGYFWSFGQNRSYASGTTTVFTRVSDGGESALTTGVENVVTYAGLNALFLDDTPQVAYASCVIPDGSDWSVAFHHLSGATRTFCVINSVNDVLTFYRDGVSGATINCFVSDAVVGPRVDWALFGYAHNSNTPADIRYEGVQFRPYVLGTEAMRAAAEDAIPLGVSSGAPFVWCYGDILQHNTPKLYKITVDSEDLEPAVLDGAFAYSARRLQLKLVER
jgi:hypothetical protein